MLKAYTLSQPQVAPEGDDVEFSELVRLQPSPRHIAEENVQVTIRPVAVAPQILAKQPAQRRLELHDVVRRLFLVDFLGSSKDAAARGCSGKGAMVGFD